MFKSRGHYKTFEKFLIRSGKLLMRKASTRTISKLQCITFITHSSKNSRCLCTLSVSTRISKEDLKESATLLFLPEIRGDEWLVPYPSTRGNSGREGAEMVCFALLYL